MKVLVTGANGFLAANVIRELLIRKIAVKAMVRESSNLQTIGHLPIEIFKGSINLVADVDEAVKGCDVIIHAAAATSQRFIRMEALYQTNVEATAILVHAAKRHRVKRFICVSTANTIAPGDTVEPGVEHNGLGVCFSHSAYALSKLKAEEIIQAEVENNQLNAVIVNPTFMLGAYDSKPSSGRIFFITYHKRLAFLPKGGKNFIDVTNASRAICNAIEFGKAGERFLLAGENHTYKEFFRIVNGSYKALVISIPNCFIKFFGAVGSCFRIFGVHAEMNWYNARILCSSHYYSGEKAGRVLKMPRSNLYTASDNAIQWFMDNDYL